MRTTVTLATDTTERDAAADPCAAIRAHLEAARREVLAAIRGYPAPITACDAQFNHLLEQRERIAAELRRLDALSAAHPGGAVPGAALDAFLAASPCFDHAARRHLLETGRA
jgi:hypothetical protein